MAEEIQARSRLGRGLAALIGDAGEESDALSVARGQRRVPIEFLRPNPLNPRRAFREEELDELAASIRAKGVLQPILVRGAAGIVDAYEIIAGERRWRASQRAELREVPVIVVEAGDREALELAIIENVQRSDLDPLDEAQGYENLIEQFSYAQAELAKIVGKSRSHIANTMRLTKLPDSVKRRLRDGQLSAGHGRALLGVKDPDTVCRIIVGQGLTVRDVERMAQAEAEQAQAEAGGAAPKPARAKPAKDEDARALERALTEVLGLAVTIDHRGGGGRLTIRYASLDQLEALCRKMQG